MAQTPGIDLFLDRIESDEFPVIQIQLSAWDASGLPLTGLTAQDFTLQEGNGIKFHPTAVEVDTKTDLRVILAMDVSASMQGKPINDAKVAAARFLENLEKGDQAGLVAFSTDVNPDPAALSSQREHALSTNLLPLYDTIEALQASGGTELYNAAAKAVKLLEGTPSGHRAVLLLSDGKNDPANIGDPEEAIQLAKEARVPFFIIGLGSTIDEPYLQRLAAETGGLYRPAPSSSDLAALFSDMGELLKTRYVVRYTTTLPADGRSAALSVELNMRGETANTEALIETPLIPPTATAAPQATPVPTSTAVPVSAPAVAPPAEEPQEPEPVFNWGWAAIAGAAAIATIAYLLIRKPKPKPEACAKCGYELTGSNGPCPQCGESRRLPRSAK
ncbi:vWA domain-containing protein [Levilinea saccharolytica]|uniref:vWA domain-containing protein n=1 Tax=Levilinea saccharolytica TaxID=229921 RepID=UPI001364CECF|nr:VWA domain-containing protein [Levilinea saccharolytica]